jgi:iron(III) transport system substrate-binding protein
MFLRARVWAVFGALAILATACGGGSGDTLTIYTSVTQATVDAVVAGFDQDLPETTVEVFRAPTGEVVARIEAERRNGTVGADVIWLSDPLSMYQYESDGMLSEWAPTAASGLPSEIQTPSFWGTRVLHLVIVTRAGNPFDLEAWSDLVDPSLAIAIPDPLFAGSAFAALGYFGLDYFDELRAAGAVQVPSPGDVVTGVAEGRYDAGITLEFSARSAATKGSPVEVVWPSPGAVAVTSPIAVLADTDRTDRARAFVEHVLSANGQTAIGATGWAPVLPGIAGPSIPAGTEIVYPDWESIFVSQDALVAGYEAIFGG